MEKKNFSGFTLVEILLVFAVGGLIFAMAFIALPGLMSNRRDSERRDDVLLLINRLKNFQANSNRGSLPEMTGATLIANGSGDTEWDKFYNDYMGDSFLDPDGTPYSLLIVKCGASKLGEECGGTASVINSQNFAENGYKMYVVVQAKCDATKAVKSANSRNVAVLYKLERADVFCSNS